MKQRPLLVIFLIVFIDLLGFGIFIPILPFYADSLGATAFMATLLLMSYSGMQFLFNPIWGRLSDKFGRRPILLTSILGMAGAMTLVGFSNSLLWLFVGRLLGGLFAANISTASAYIADVTPPEDRAKKMGAIIGVSFGMGFLLGPALGGLLAKFSQHGSFLMQKIQTLSGTFMKGFLYGPTAGPFVTAGKYGQVALFVAILSFLNFILAFLILPEPARTEGSRKPQHISIWDKQRFKELVQRPQIAFAIFIFFLATFGFSQLEGVFGFFVKDSFQFGATQAGYLHSLVALMMVPIQGGALGRLVKKFQEPSLITVGTGLAAFALFLAGFGHYALFIVALMLLGLGYSVINPSLSSLVSRSAEKDVQGATMGLYHGAGSLARMVGPPMAGFFYDHLGRAIPLWSAAFFFALASFIGWRKKNLWS